jgi:hypothetical protein
MKNQRSVQPRGTVDYLLLSVQNARESERRPGIVTVILDADLDHGVVEC